MTNTQAPAHNQLTHLLTTLHRQITTLEDQLIQTTRPSENPTCRPQPGSQAPLNLEVLHYLLNDVEPIISGWALNLASDLQVPLPRQPGTAWWARWLIDHQGYLAQRPWIDDCIQELGALSTTLADKENPPGVQFLTVKDMARLWGKTPEAVTKQLQRMDPPPERVRQGGVYYYRMEAH